MASSVSPVPPSSSPERAWRILVVDDEENLNWSIVTSLRKERYLVEGARSAEEAIRLLWTQDFDVIISDIKMPGMDGFDLLSWVRVHRPGLRILMITAFGSITVRTQALQQGAVAYLEKPFDLRALKEELRHLLYRTGFAANLEAFDLLDVAQIINIARKTITTQVEIGIASKGLLHFVNGELVWAEFGELRGEEAFFAIAAHKTGVLIQEPQAPAGANVALPIARLIMQAVQYREKYASEGSNGPEPAQGALLAPIATNLPAPAHLAIASGSVRPLRPWDGRPIAEKREPAPPIPRPSAKGNTDSPASGGPEPTPTAPQAGAKAIPAPSPTLPQVLATISSEAPGFTAIAIVRSDGIVVAQHSRAPGNLTGPAGHLTAAVQAMLRALLLGGWGDYEDTVITGSTHYVLLRRLQWEGGMFELLITTRDSNLGLCRMLLRTWEQPLIATLRIAITTPPDGPAPAE
jgi:CheY-like chemotaxis protein